MVIDNVDDLTIFKGPRPGGNTQAQSRLRHYVPRTGQYSTGSVLWTSRDQSILGSLLGLNAGLELGRMNDSEARELLGGLRGPVLQNDDANHTLEDELIHLLESLPLAIAQAAAYIRIRRVTIKRYVGLFRQSEERMQQLLSVEFDDKDRMDVPNAVMKTWMISMDLLSKEDPLTRQILMIVACLDRQDIPFKLLQTALTKMATQSLANNHNRAVVFEADIQFAASRLVDYSLLNIQRQDDDGVPVYEQHRLVHLANKCSMKCQENSDALHTAVETLRESFPRPHSDNFSEYLRMYPHMRSVSDMAGETSLHPPLSPRHILYAEVAKFTNEALESVLLQRGCRMKSLGHTQSETR